MRKKLLIVALCANLLVFLVAIEGTAQVPRPVASSVPVLQGAGKPGGRQRTPQKEHDSEGQMLVRRAEATLQRNYTVSAQIRQTALILGHEVIGSGEYCEQRSNQGLRFRLELKIQSFRLGHKAQTRDEETASGLLQLCDGRYLWNYRKLMGAESLSCVDYALVQQRLEEKGPQNIQVLDNWPGLGGLPKLLRSFDKAFVFDSPEGGHLQKDFPAWKVEGRWRPEMLARAVPEHKEAIEQGRGVELEDLPEHLPNCVTLFLGKDDLFPYSIVYYRLKGNTANVRASRDDSPMVQIDMANVRFNQPIRAAQFVYKPGLKYTDGTERMLEKLGLR